MCVVLVSLLRDGCRLMINEVGSFGAIRGFQVLIIFENFCDCASLFQFASSFRVENNDIRMTSKSLEWITPTLIFEIQ